MGSDRQRAIELYQDGARHHDVRDFELAVKYYKSALEADPSHELIYNDLSVALVSLDRHDEALPYIQRAYQKRPNNVPVVANLLSCLARLQRYGEARQILDTVVGNGLDPREQFSWPMVKVVGDIYFSTNSMDQASVLFESVLTQYPDNYNCLMKAAFCQYDVLQLGKTLEHLKKVRKIDPDCPVACAQMARCYRDVGLPSMATKYCRLLKEIDSDFELLDLAEFYS